MAAHEGCERCAEMNKGCAEKCFCNRGLGINDKKFLYEGVIIVPTALYRADTWGMKSAERRKVNFIQMKCSRSLVRVLPMDKVMNEEVRMRAGIERELVSIADHSVLR